MRYKLTKRQKRRIRRMKKLVLPAGVVLSTAIGLVSLFGSIGKKKDVDDKILLGQPITYDYGTTLGTDDFDLLNQVDYYQDSDNVLAAMDYLVHNVTYVEEDQYSFEEKTIMKYCSIYQVDYDTVYNKLSELTDNFSNDDYRMGTIKGITFKKRPIYFENKETLLAMAVRCCKQTPGSVNLNSSIRTDVYFDSNLDIFQQITDYANLFGLDRNVVYGIICAENGFGSSFTDSTNNFGSIRSDGSTTSFASYDNMSEGLLEACAEIYKFKDRYGLSDDPEQFIREVQQYYAPTEGVSDWERDLNNNWVPNAIGAYSNAKNGSVFHDETYTQNKELDSELYLQCCDIRDKRNQNMMVN